MDNLPRFSLPVPLGIQSVVKSSLYLFTVSLLWFFLSFPDKPNSNPHCHFSAQLPGLLAVPPAKQPVDTYLHMKSFPTLISPPLYLQISLNLWCFFMWFFHPSAFLLDHCLLLCFPIILPSYISKLKTGFYSTLLAGSLRAETFFRPAEPSVSLVWGME